MPKIITQDELRKTKGIGASEVAAILSLSPWTTAYDLWQQKTGRKPKPPQTKQMLDGIAKEPIAFQEYLDLTGYKDMEQQVIAVHPDLPYIRCIADGWSEKRGVEIKCPQSQKDVEAARQGTIPDHYALQLATCMAVFGVESWDYYVFDPEGSELVGVTFSQPFHDDTLLKYWQESALPEIERFWGCVCNDKWTTEGTPEINERRWLTAIEARKAAVDKITWFEDQKFKAEAEIKQMIGGAKSATAAGWTAGWQNRQGSFAAEVKVESKESMQEILTALEAIKGLPGVKGIEAKVRDATRAFKVEKIK